MDKRVIAEGFRLLPHLVKPLLADYSHAVWLLPTPEFRLRAVDSRRTGWEFLRRTSDPKRGRRNLLELPLIEVDVAMTEDELTRRLTQAFDL